ncbi:MAG: TIGR03960 family B12-binding radical SAM protein [Nitrospirae bacterium]|nr:TIGR03960 family B12-binding radical SAM protein [Nitrospirota bacterium]
MDNFLPLVQRPSRYIGNEINSVHKDPDKMRVSVALAFPDTYEIGMSHLGLKILYKILNDMPDVSAERVYAPWIDYEKILRAKGLPLRSLESSKPLNNFDIIGFTLQYELSYTNILNILDLSNIPLRSEDRNGEYPLIIAGGPCAFNPEPLADFIDAFLIGDGEEAIVEIINIYKEWKSGRGTKDELLKRLSGIEGLYVPSLYEINYLPDGRIKDIKGAKVKKRFLTYLGYAPFPDRPVLPYLKTVHDRVTIEIARGCTRGCRFCQAGIIYRPWRERSPEEVIPLTEESLRNTGYEEISLASLNSGDYSGLLPLIKNLNTRLESKRVSISLPSLRIGTLTDEILREIKKIRKTGVTIAPEAGTERLRRVINKELAEGEFEKTVRWIFDEGWDTLKLYFMIGLPTEKEEDLKGIIDTVRNVFRLRKERNHRIPNINLGISTFVPKAHTPFQWKGQIPLQEIRDRMDYLKGHLKRGKFRLKGQGPEMSLLEAVFARGDRKLGNLIEKAFRLGCRFDGWTECFDYNRWNNAFEESGIDPRFYANRDIELQDTLPWDFIETGVKKEFLEREYKKAFLEKGSKDCRYGPCLSCGLPCEMEKRVRSTTHGSSACPDKRSEIGEFRVKGPESTTAAHSSRLTLNASRFTIPIRVRCRFSKTGPMRFLSHLELMTAIQRAVTRAEIPVAFSLGFNPHPKISFGPALPVGIEGLREYFDIDLTLPVNIEKVIDTLNRTLPKGLHIHNARAIYQRSKSLSSIVKRYIYSLEVSRSEIELLKKNLIKERIPFERKTGKGLKQVDLRPMILDLNFSDGKEAIITLQDTEEYSVKPLEVLEVLLNRDPLISKIRRVALLGMSNGGWVEPLNVVKDE